MKSDRCATVLRRAGGSMMRFAPVSAPRGARFRQEKCLVERFGVEFVSAMRKNVS
jgi:hypothetical protein